MQIINDLGISVKLCNFIPSLFDYNGDEMRLFTVFLPDQWANKAYSKGKTGQ
jgi:hypothetical protein